MASEVVGVGVPARVAFPQITFFHTMKKMNNKRKIDQLMCGCFFKKNVGAQCFQNFLYNSSINCAKRGPINVHGVQSTDLNPPDYKGPACIITRDKMGGLLLTAHVVILTRGKKKTSCIQRTFFFFSIRECFAQSSFFPRPM
jgi:hypothetical protein